MVAIIGHLDAGQLLPPLTNDRPCARHCPNTNPKNTKCAPPSFFVCMLFVPTGHSQNYSRIWKRSGRPAGIPPASCPGLPGLASHRGLPPTSLPSRPHSCSSIADHEKHCWGTRKLRLLAFQCYQCFRCSCNGSLAVAVQNDLIKPRQLQVKACINMH